MTGDFGEECSSLPKFPFLVVAFRSVERPPQDDFGSNLLVKSALEVGDAPLRLIELCLVLAEQDGSVLRAAAISSGIVARPEQAEKVLERELFPVEMDLKHLGVRAEVVIGRVDLIPAGVSDLGTHDASKTPEPGVRTPESAEAEGDSFDLRDAGAVDARAHLDTMCPWVPSRPPFRVNSGRFQPRGPRKLRLRARADR